MTFGPDFRFEETDVLYVGGPAGAVGRIPELLGETAKPGWRERWRGRAG